MVREKGGEMENSMTFNILIKKVGDEWVAHCLELDIVATADSLETLKTDILDLITTQVDYAFSNNNLDNLYRPAPAEVWQEFYACRNAMGDKISFDSAFRNKSINTFVPPWIIANTRLAQESTVA